jgi:hypothetical protein
MLVVGLGNAEKRRVNRLCFALCYFMKTIMLEKQERFYFVEYRDDDGKRVGDGSFTDQNDAWEAILRYLGRGEQTNGIDVL